MNPTKHKKKMLEIFFEKFQVPAVFVAVQGVLSLYPLPHKASQPAAVQESYSILETVSLT